MKEFTLEIRTPEKSLFFDRILSLNVNSLDGKIGILPQHAPLSAVLSAGDVIYKLESGEEKRNNIKSGFLIVKNNAAYVLVD